MFPGNRDHVPEACPDGTAHDVAPTRPEHPSTQSLQLGGVYAMLWGSCQSQQARAPERRAAVTGAARTGVGLCRRGRGGGCRARPDTCRKSNGRRLRGLWQTLRTAQGYRVPPWLWWVGVLQRTLSGLSWCRRSIRAGTCTGRRRLPLCCTCWECSHRAPGTLNRRLQTYRPLRGWPR